MNSRLVAVVVLAMAPCPARSQQAEQPPTPPANYVVHEWGTFTSMVGTDGLVLEGLHREEETLPEFVHDLLAVREFGVIKSKLPASRVTQKMETPVIYFHTDEPLHVQVSVWFKQGLMTQFYPLPDEVRPRLRQLQQQRVDMSKVQGSQLVWNVDLVPRAQPMPECIPPVSPGESWGLARQVSAAYVRTRPAAGAARVEAEHYLFYRGLGRWQPDIAIEVDTGGDVTLHNAMIGRIPFVAVLEMGPSGGRFLLGQSVAPGADREFELATVSFDPDRVRVSRRLGAAVMKALVDEGLHLDEARAMVATWSRSWFLSDGSRAIYLLPRPVVDQVLPLHLEPRPRRLVRALVGRLEFITHSAQARVERALKAVHSRLPAEAASAQVELRRLDRFLEPHLRNVVRAGRSPAARRQAERILALEFR